MKPEIQISHLKTLIAIDEEGSFGAAAERVGRTQSAVTQQMQVLDQILGTPVFAANGRKRELTEAGQALLRHSREIVSMCNFAISTSRRSQQTGILRIGAPHEVAEDFLSRALKQFSEEWPSVHTIIHFERSPVLMEMLEEGRLDIAVSTRRSENYDSTLLTKMPIQWIASSDWEPEPGAPWPLVLTNEPSLFRRIVLSALDLGGHDHKEVLTSTSLVGVRMAVAAGLGITARTESSFYNGTRVLGAQWGLPPLPDITFYLHRPGNDNSEPRDQLFDIIIEHAANSSS